MIRSFCLLFLMSATVVVVSASSSCIGRNDVVLHHFHHQYQNIMKHKNDDEFNFKTSLPSSTLVATMNQQRRTTAAISSTTRITCLPRGGASLITEEEEENSNIVITKLRNIIRSLLQISERKNQSVANVFRKMIQTLEHVMGVRLLPLVKKEKKKKNHHHQKTAASKKKKKSSTTPASTSTPPKTKTKTKTTTTATTPKVKPPSATAQKHLSAKLKSNSPNYRLQKELKQFLTSPPPNLSVSVSKNIRVWIVTITGADNTIYEGEKYRLRMTFPPNYPTSPPSVYFLPPTPKHEHVYTNGDICLSLLGRDWRPTMTGQSLAVSILSLLSSAREKSLPMDNARHAQNKPGGKQDDWVYHDDNC